MKTPIHTHTFDMYLNARLCDYTEGGIRYALNSYDDAEYSDNTILLTECSVTVEVPEVELTLATIDKKEDKLELLKTAYLAKKLEVEEEIASLLAIENNPTDA